MRRTKADALLTREALLDAAEQVFGERGVSRTSLQDIARAAGLSRGAVYWHFEDKSALFNAMMARTTQPMLDTLEAVQPEPTVTPLLGLRESTLQALHQLQHDARTRRVFDIAIHKVEYVDDLLGARCRHLKDHRDCQQRIQALFERAQALGQVPPQTPAAVLTAGYQALVGGLIQNWLLDETLFDLETVAPQVIDAYLRGVAGH